MIKAILADLSQVKFETFKMKGDKHCTVFIGEDKK